jgi:hypothetical protein
LAEIAFGNFSRHYSVARRQKAWFLPAAPSQGQKAWFLPAAYH